LDNFKHLDRVKCKEFEKSPLVGTLVGWAVVTRMREQTLMGVVQLDEGFWSEDKGTYVSLLVVHKENLEHE
jgi:hypothetical protein